MYVCEYNNSKYALDIVKYIVSIDKSTLKDNENTLLSLIKFSYSEYKLDIINYLENID